MILKKHDEWNDLEQKGRGRESWKLWAPTWFHGSMYIESVWKEISFLLGIQIFIVRNNNHFLFGTLTAYWKTFFFSLFYLIIYYIYFLFYLSFFLLIYSYRFNLHQNEIDDWYFARIGYLINKYNSLVMKLLNNHITNWCLTGCCSTSNTCHIPKPKSK